MRRVLLTIALLGLLVSTAQAQTIRIMGYGGSDPAVVQRLLDEFRMTHEQASRARRQRSVRGEVGAHGTNHAARVGTQHVHAIHEQRLGSVGIEHLPRMDRIKPLL